MDVVEYVGRLEAEIARLRALSAGLVEAVKAYRAQHDRILWERDRPCRCDECVKGRAALAAAAEPTA